MTLYSYRFRVPWVDTDSAMVVHYSNYLRYCERVEEMFLNTLNLDFNEISKKYNVWFPRISASCQYRWPLRFNQWVRVDLIDIEVGEKHCKYKYQIWNEDEGKLSAECEIVVVTADKIKGKAVPIPTELRNKLITHIKRLKNDRLIESRRMIEDALNMAYQVYVEVEGRLGDKWRDKSWEELLNHLKDEIVEIENTSEPHERLHDCLDACVLSAILAAKTIIEYKLSFKK